MENFKIKTFLAANSCDGFVSYFSQCYEPKKGWKAFIIKGGPGTGKSSFMKYIARKGADKGFECELCPCSSDPNSLDAVIFPQIRTVIMDGTAPHTVDPMYPGVCESILNFGEFWEKEKFSNTEEKIIEITNKNKSLHKTASLYLQAAGSFLTDNFKTAESSFDVLKAEKYTQKLCDKYFKKQNKLSSEKVRFLSGVTPKGIVFFSNTITELCKEIIIIKDDFGCVADFVLRKVRHNALKNGYDIITVKNALLPNLYDHIIIPEIGLGFVRESAFTHIKIDVRKIHAKRFLDMELLNKSKEKIKFNNKAANELLLTAAKKIQEAKSVHDDLEKYYIDAMNFESLTKFANDFLDMIF